MKHIVSLLFLFSMCLPLFAESPIDSVPIKLSNTGAVPVTAMRKLPTLGDDGKWANFYVGELSDFVLNRAVKNDILYVIGTLPSSGNPAIYRNRFFCENNQSAFANGIVTATGGTVRFSSPVDLSGYATNDALATKADKSEIKTPKAVEAGDGVAVDSLTGKYIVSVPTLSALTTQMFQKASAIALRDSLAKLRQDSVTINMQLAAEIARATAAESAKSDTAHTHALTKVSNALLSDNNSIGLTISKNGRVPFFGGSPTSSVPTATTYFALDVEGNIRIGANNSSLPTTNRFTTHNLLKSAAMVMVGYDTARCLQLVTGQSSATYNLLNFGGGNGRYDAATEITFFTGGYKQTTGTRRLVIDSVGKTSFFAPSTDFGATTGSQLNLTTANAPGSIATPLYTDMNFKGYNGKTNAQIRSWDESSNTGFGNLQFCVASGSNSQTSDIIAMSIVREGNGNVGFGTTAPKARIQVADGDVYISNSQKGIILTATGGGCWRVTIDDTGNFVRTSITCPN